MRKKKPREFPSVEIEIDSLTHEGRGVGRIDGKTWFVDGAMAGERVIAKTVKTHKTYTEATTESVLRPSEDRVKPRCDHFGVCGGCSLQHIRDEAQIQIKQGGLIQNLARIGKVECDNILPAITSKAWGYRRRARLGVKYVEKKQRLLIGFREKHSHFLADLQSCPVLVPEIGERFSDLAKLIQSLSVYQQIPQIEISQSDDQTALVIRHLVAMTDDDKRQLREFEKQTGFLILLQPGDLTSIQQLDGADPPLLAYRFPDDAIEIRYLPTEFVQVNADINRQMVPRAIELLDIQPNELVMDLFCGVGNFTLPISRRANHVIGVEGEGGLVARARENANRNGISNAEFHHADLAKDISIYPWANHSFDKLLLDPARAGAIEVLVHLKTWRPKKIVYVSCNPSTLARDANFIVNDCGYHLDACGVMDMFPHTTHVESMAVFSR